MVLRTLQCLPTQITVQTRLANQLNFLGDSLGCEGKGKKKEENLSCKVKQKRKIQSLKIYFSSP